MKWEFEPRNDESTSSNEKESIVSDEEVEQQNPAIRRFDHVKILVDMYSSPKFCSTFVLYVSDEDPEVDKISRRLNRG